MDFLKRIIIYIFCFITVVTINFWLPRMMPGDPAILLMAQDGVQVRPEQLQELHKKLRLDEPLYIQFAGYLLDLLKGDWGFSYQRSQYVSALLKNALSCTLSLSVPSILISACLAMFLGCLAGYYQNSKYDNICTTALIVLYAMPAFLLGMVLLYVFSFKLRVFPLGGLHSTTAGSGKSEKALDLIYHLFLPITTLSLSSITSKYLIIRNSVIKERNSKYVVYAKARGLGNGSILFKHIFKNSCQPFISMIGINIGFIFAGSLTIETVFSLNGMGSLIYDATVTRDFVVIQGVFLLLSIMVILANLAADIISALIDPRIRKGAYDEV
ncbi:MAG: ABC transporter permease [Clostridiales bacterium]|nr:ABC transporter permease [Clostridiales bacterium]